MPMTTTSSSNSLAIFTTSLGSSCAHLLHTLQLGHQGEHQQWSFLPGQPLWRSSIQNHAMLSPQQRLRCHHRNSVVCHLQGMLDSEETCALLCMDRVEEYSSSRPPATAVSVRTLQESFMKGKERCTILLVRDTSNEQPYCKGRLLGPHQGGSPGTETLQGQIMSSSMPPVLSHGPPPWHCTQQPGSFCPVLQVYIQPCHP